MGATKKTGNDVAGAQSRFTAGLGDERRWRIERKNGDILRGEQVAMPVLCPDLSGAFRQETFACEFFRCGHRWGL